MKYIISLILILSQFQIYSQSLIKTEQIDKLIDVQGTTQTFSIAIDEMIEIQKELNPYLDLEFWNRLKMELCKDNFRDLKNLIIPIYDNHFSEKQIKNIIQFYESETGKHLVEKQSIIINESMNAGTIWGEQVGLKIHEEISKTDAYKFNIEFNNCEGFKIGKYKMILPDSSEIIINRTQDYQTEIYKDKTYEYEIEWLSTCRFKIIEIGKGFESSNYNITSNIYEIKEEECKIISKMDGREVYDKVTLIKIE